MIALLFLSKFGLSLMHGQITNSIIRRHTVSILIGTYYSRYALSSTGILYNLCPCVSMRSPHMPVGRGRVVSNE
ncbi:hypothetical protein F5878DRAFT_203319 [Lentinula raphanica]|uniref:Secreted protein n=1 Tax=Lentinula raphanica TaxID=153919 RepID=A0AA38P7G4_9AGAR|nr:hypothetical protein F5878DRAFT_203319 [Lentinula raphanica]